MTLPTVLVTGFGPFLDVTANPSGTLAKRLAATPPDGVEVVGRVLPVSYARTPVALAAAMAEVAAPRAMLALGLHRGSWLRLEARARARLDSPAPDAEGVHGLDLPPLGRRDLECSLDLERLASALRAAGAPDVRISRDAGGYLCERVYYDLLRAGQTLGLPALFVHVPALDLLGLDIQERVLRALVVELACPQTPGEACARA